MRDQLETVTHLSHCLRVHEAIIHNETIKTNNTVPGHIVIKVFKTNLRKRKGEQYINLKCRYLSQAIVPTLY